MAGDWIKIRSNIGTDPDVVDIASRVGLDEYSVVGRLHALWSWADQHSCDGFLPRATSAFLDRLTACPGFAEALRQVGWLEGRDSALRLPNWDRHNGNTAKSRALEARKKQRQRDKCPAVSPGINGTRQGLEKRREEKNTDQDVPPAPLSTSRTNGNGVSEGRDSSVIPTTDQSKRFAAIFRRKLTTPWTRNEVSAYKLLGKVEEEDLAAVESYYSSNWPPRRDVNILRHNLITFLNNWPGEVDRAKAAKTKPKQSRSMEWTPTKNSEQPTSEEDLERIKAKAKEQFAQFKAEHGR